MKKNKDSALLDSITLSRKVEKIAIADARLKASDWVREQTEEEHSKVLDAVRDALIAGYSARQIGIAYGSTDPYTAKRLVMEAQNSSSKSFVEAMENHPEWLVEVHDTDRFTIKAFALGEQKLSGEGLFTVDEDGENFTQIDGDSFIQVQMYRLGLVEQVLEEVRG
jgi:hypothetical protein